MHKPTTPSDAEMVDANPEVVAVIKELPTRNKASPFKSSLGETLPSGVEINFSSFL